MTDATRILQATDKTQGLSHNEAKERLLKFGPNEIQEKKRNEVLLFFISQCKDPIILILLLAVAIKIATKGTTDALAIGAVLVFNTVLGLFQQLKASKALQALKELIHQESSVIREGLKQNISSNLLVPGDILVLESGMRIPADAELLETLNFYVDESMLTGESIAVEKNTASPIYSGTVVTRGRALAQVTGTGAHTKLGHIAHSLSTIDETLSPLQKKTSKVRKVLKRMDHRSCRPYGPHGPISRL